MLGGGQCQIILLVNGLGWVTANQSPIIDDKFQSHPGSTGTLGALAT